MNSQPFKDQVEILVRMLPYVAEEECFAMHGGTAINFFVLDMPRLSVNIDLTYLPSENRQTALQNIVAALERIKTRAETEQSDIKIIHEQTKAKLRIRTKKRKNKT